MVRRIGIVLVIVLVMIGASASASASATGGAAVQRLVSFDASGGELPEGVAVDKRGTIFLTLAPLGKLVGNRSGGRRRGVKDPLCLQGILRSCGVMRSIWSMPAARMRSRR